MDNEVNHILTIKEFAKEIGVHPNTVRRMIQKNRISFFRVGGGRKSGYRIARTEIQRLAIFELDQAIEKKLKELQKQNQ